MQIQAPSRPPGGAATGQATLSPASLQAQLDLYRHRLADCVNCSTAATPSGKSAIATLTAAISQIEQRIAKAPDRPAPVAEKAPGGAGSGTLIDVYA